MPAQAVLVAAPDRVRLGRFLPLSLAITAAVTVAPLVAVSRIGPARSLLAVALHVLLAVALSVAVARAIAALWARYEQSSDLVFGDLLLWGWARRALAERRLDAATRQIEAPTQADEDRGALLRRMSDLLEARDPYTHGHSRRVARHAERIAREMGLAREQVAKIRAAALVHDIGKINVPRSILNKPERLTDTEFALVKRHAADGAAMVAVLGDSELTAIVRHHHERTDGTGYPDGIAGGDIPVGARIIAVADTFDAITSTRAYRKPRTHKQALEVLEQEAGTQLDELAVAAFVSYYAAHRSVELATVLAVAPQRLLSGLGGVQSGVAAGVAPIAQTACGIGGVALIGACLGGPMPASDSSASHDTAHRQFAAQTGKPATGSGPTSQSRRAGGRSHARRDGPGSDNRSRLSTSPREKSSAPRALETPVTDTPSEDQGGSGGGGGGGGSGGGVSLPIVPPSGPSLPAIPAVPDVQDVLDPVTDGVTGTRQLKLPQLGLP